MNAEKIAKKLTKDISTFTGIKYQAHLKYIEIALKEAYCEGGIDALKNHLKNHDARK